MTTRSTGTFDVKLAPLPESGTGDLSNLSGIMMINIDAGNHSYEFDYTIGREPQQLAALPRKSVHKNSL